MGSGPIVHMQISRYIQANSFLCEVGMGSGPNVTMHISRYTSISFSLTYTIYGKTEPMLQYIRFSLNIHSIERQSIPYHILLGLYTM